MIAVDTNLIVRLLTEDDPGQAKRAAKTMASDQIFIPKTVILETEWVLRYAYEISREDICNGFRKLLGLPNLEVEDQQSVFQAISWFSKGLDFADALHLASSPSANSFVTFDKDFIKKARSLGLKSITSP